MDGPHDMGGMHGFGPVVVDGCERVADEPWELRIFGLSSVIDAEGLGAGAGRPIREQMPPARYLAASYYERWVYSTEEKVTRSGRLAHADVDAWMARLAAGEERPTLTDAEMAERARAAMRSGRTLAAAEAPVFAPGDRVRVRRMHPEGHTRCPRYVRGATGAVEAVRGSDRLPDIGPYRGPQTPVYAVAFASDELFGPADESWDVVLDLFETYLEPA